MNTPARMTAVNAGAPPCPPVSPQHSPPPSGPDPDPDPDPTSLLRGTARLMTDATVGLADLVEAVHERIVRLPGLPPSGPVGRTRGITGLVYRTVRGITRVVGGSADSLLGQLHPVLGANGALPERDAVVAALNGVLGDHLARTGNPLATPMSLRQDGVALDLQAPALALAGGARPLVLIHGLCLNDLQWNRQGHDHGQRLARALGCTPLYLRYNTGLHISENGRALAGLLELLVDRWPVPIERLALLGHSMGGLVARSAVHAGRQAGHRWPTLPMDLLFLGTPHHGAPLERATHALETVLGATPYAAPFVRLSRLRSHGITDLRYGNLLDEDWAPDRHPARDGSDHRRPLPLPVGARCHAVASTLGQESATLKGRLLGDGLVPLDSALGRHRDPARCLAFPQSRQWVGSGIGHLDLMCHPAVYEQLHSWLSADPAPADSAP